MYKFRKQLKSKLLSRNTLNNVTPNLCPNNAMSVENIMNYVNVQHSAPALKQYEFTNPAEIDLLQHREPPKDIVSTRKLMAKKEHYDNIMQNDKDLAAKQKAEEEHQKLVDQIRKEVSNVPSTTSDSLQA